MQLYKQQQQQQQQQQQLQQQQLQQQQLQQQQLQQQQQQLQQQQQQQQVQPPYSVQRPVYSGSSGYSSSLTGAAGANGQPQGISSYISSSSVQHGGQPLPRPYGPSGVQQPQYPAPSGTADYRQPQIPAITNVDGRNLHRYAEYLQLLQNNYGIRLPTEAQPGQNGVPNSQGPQVANPNGRADLSPNNIPGHIPPPSPESYPNQPQVVPQYPNYPNNAQTNQPPPYQPIPTNTHISYPPTPPMSSHGGYSGGEHSGYEVGSGYLDQRHGQQVNGAAHGYTADYESYKTSQGRNNDRLGTNAPASVVPEWATPAPTYPSPQSSGGYSQPAPPRPTSAPTYPPPPSIASNRADEVGGDATTAIGALSQQIRRLPAVLYVDSRDENSKLLETTLRDTYGLPLVAFYVDKIPNSASVTHLLSELTGHEGLPYFFVCGTFIGGQEHINNYHNDGQIPRLVDHVCGENGSRLKLNVEKKKSIA
uniref:Glutaredoxin domain-containing protein n=1 Tax=Plectus sambesii TaxID=2011161 RepID=A0A914XP49_9BILA